MSDITRAEFETLISNRAGTYAFLARIYRVEADQALLERISGMDLTTGVEEPDISEGYAILDRFVSTTTESTLTELAVDYAKIFLGVSRGSGAFPYESVYTSEDRLFMQEARDEVLAAFRAEGLDRSDDFNEPEDHIALEFEFMAYLCQNALTAFQESEDEKALGYLEKQKAFLEEHILNWVPDFCRDVVEIAQTDFYKAAAKITHGYLNLEREIIDELLQEIPQDH
jgi:anaerobic sulfite reductase subunit A